MKIEGNIEFTLNIDSTEQQHSLTYQNTMQNDIAGIMIAAQALTIQLGEWKEYKKKPGVNKKAVGKRIDQIATALRALKPLMHSLLNSYEDFIAHQQESF